MALPDAHRSAWLTPAIQVNLLQVRGKGQNVWFGGEFFLSSIHENILGRKNPIQRSARNKRVTPINVHSFIHSFTQQIFTASRMKCLRCTSETKVLAFAGLTVGGSQMLNFLKGMILPTRSASQESAGSKGKER